MFVFGNFGGCAWGEDLDCAEGGVGEEGVEDCACPEEGDCGHFLYLSFGVRLDIIVSAIRHVYIS